MMDCGLLPVAGRSIVFKAGWVIADAETIYPNGYVRVENGIIMEVGSGKPSGGLTVRDLGSGALFPAFVNAHTHLELCALKGCLKTDKGFGFWIKELIQKREQLSSRALTDAAVLGIRELTASGCGVVGEISSLGLTRDVLADSALSGIWFRECLGEKLTEVDIGEHESKDLIVSYSGHAPHTTSPAVLKEIKVRTDRLNLPFSIHVAESDEEMDFMKSGKGPWKDFLLSRGIDSKSWGLPVESPVRHLQNIGILDGRTLLVHLLHADETALDIIRTTGAHVCVCPRSNSTLHHRLPDLAQMMQTGINLCLGTDSPASTESLSMFDEAAFVSRNYPDISPEKIFQMATLGGAAALGLEKKFGTLIPGKSAGMAYAEIQASEMSQVMERLVNFSESIKLTH
jgi:aminodeoxyfutalosine deaminase